MEPAGTTGICARADFLATTSRTHPDRLTHPLIRRNGTLVASHLGRGAGVCRRADHPTETGPWTGRHSAVSSTSRCTNEDLYVFQKFMRLVIGTNKLDSSARYGHMNGIQALRRVQGTHRWTVTFEDILSAQTHCCSSAPT